VKISYFKGLFKKVNLKFLSSENIENDYYEIKFEKPKNFNWIAGEHAIFSIPSKKFQGKKWRAFSIASSPKEENIIIGTRTGVNPSNFKRTMIELEKGDLVKMRGPFGWFVSRDENSPLVMIALGVGITPIRSLLMDNLISDRILNVIYSSHNTYLFEKELVEAAASPNAEITFTRDIKDTKSEILKAIETYHNDAYYYIGGNPLAIKSITKILRKNKIKRKKIIHDPFYGY